MSLFFSLIDEPVLSTDGSEASPQNSVDYGPVVARISNVLMMRVFGFLCSG